MKCVTCIFGIETRLQAARSGVGVLARTKDFFLGSTQHPLQWLLGFFLDLKEGLMFTTHLHLGLRLRASGAVRLIPLIRLYDMDGGNLTFYALLMMMLIAQSI